MALIFRDKSYQPSKLSPLLSKAVRLTDPSQVNVGGGLFSHKVFLKSFCKSQSLHKSVNLFCISVMIKDKLPDLCDKLTFQNDFLNTFSVIRVHRVLLSLSQLLLQNLLGDVNRSERGEQPFFVLSRNPSIVSL